MNEWQDELDEARHGLAMRWADLEAYVLDLGRVDVVLHGDGTPMVVDRADTNHRSEHRQLRRLVLAVVEARRRVLSLDRP